MARIKCVLNERRLAYEGAVQLHEERRLRLIEGGEAQEAGGESAADMLAAPRAKTSTTSQDALAQAVAASIFENVDIPPTQVGPPKE